MKIRIIAENELAARQKLFQKIDIHQVKEEPNPLDDLFKFMRGL